MKGIKCRQGGYPRFYFIVGKQRSYKKEGQVLIRLDIEQCHREKW